MSKKLLISIVDDNQCFREALESLVLSVGYDVASFGCAEDYLASDFVPQTACLISDWQLPGMSGADLQDRLLAGGHRIPVLFVTAFCAEIEQNRMLKAGALSILPKPFDASTLIECLNKTLGTVDRSS